jgi:PKD repeat protein
MSTRAPIANLTGPSSAMVGAVVRVDGSQSTDDHRVRGGAVQWGDGESLKFDGRPAAYEHVYESPGVYDVTLVVVDAERQLDSARLTITVEAAQTDPTSPPVDRPPVAVNEVLGDWYLKSAGEWSACLPSGVQTRSEVWCRLIVTPAANGGHASTEAEREETRTGSQACVYIPPVVDPPAADLLTAIDAANRVWSFDPADVSALGSRVLVDGVAVYNGAWGSTSTEVWGVAFRLIAGAVYVRQANGAWLASDPAGFVPTETTADGGPVPNAQRPVPASGGGYVPPPLPEPSPLASPHGTVIDQLGQSFIDYYGREWKLVEPAGEKSGHFIGWSVSVDGVCNPEQNTGCGDLLMAWHPPGETPCIYQRNTYPMWYRLELPWDLVNSGPSVAVDPRLPREVFPAPMVGHRALRGGWRFEMPPLPAGGLAGGTGCLAMRYEGNTPVTAWVSTGNNGPGPIREYALPPMGEGDDPAQWPLVPLTRELPEWQSGGSPTTDYCNGLIYWRGKLWMTFRTFYDMRPDPITHLIAQDGETIIVPVPRQKFAGFVKRGPGLDPLLGAGGDESGQGASCGPTLATLDGKRLIEYGRPELPGEPFGDPMAHWNERAPREPNYNEAFHGDSWLAWEPRMINGERQGRWAADRVYGGGLVLPEGVCFWPWMGTGTIFYYLQQPTFGIWELRRTPRYIYDPATYALDRYERTGLGEVRGHELGPDGAVYLSVLHWWPKAGDPLPKTMMASVGMFR